jgi:CheY-like chemotaxis protein
MKKILLIEDNPDNADLVLAYLDTLYDIHTCADSFDALAMLKAGNYQPDLLLCDISLPGMDGVQLLSEIRKIDILQTIPAIALTSHAMKGDQERFLAAGFDDYVGKPILDDISLIEPIARLLERD